MNQNDPDEGSANGENPLVHPSSFLLHPSEDSLVERLAADMRRRWLAGERPLAEEYLRRHPALLDSPELASELICEEVRLRRQSGQAGASEVLRRFPRWQAQLRVLLE